ncbi:isochorismatase family protein [Aestuariibacter halophilus]|uniref:Isochorismatase family protein n=1 Tax=Fluctibacter halophilus TaxID=226011 RepID=A0ABS8G722_9ALTE|nr:isochorismatase family protein [Aestuariibacter halophilus]MCC2615896.1 isochorismatase family protein [Aestuariibacter halophilus]
MLNDQHTGLMIIDVQGALAHRVNNAEQCLTNIKTLIVGAKHLGLPIILVAHEPDKLGPVNDHISQLLPDIPPLNKHTFNACDNQQVLEHVNSANRKQWLVCGMEAHVCVYQSARGLQQHGFEVEVVADACGSRLGDDHRIAMQRMARLGIGVTGVEMCLYELMGDARHPAFKPLLPHFKSRG